MDVQMKTDGTIGGTTVKINGKTITESGNIVGVNIYMDIGDEWASFTYDLRSMDKDGVSKVVTYRVRPETNDTVAVNRDTTEKDTQLLEVDRFIGDKVHTVEVVDKENIDPRFRGAISDMMKGQWYVTSDDVDPKDEEVDSIDKDILSQVLDDEYFNNDQESLEARFKRCKMSLSKQSGSEPFAVCAYLNPKISAKRRAQLKSKMIKNRK